MRIRYAVAVALLVAARAAVAGTGLSHVPPAEVTAGEPLRLEVRIDEGWRFAALDLHWRPPGGDWRVVPFGKAGADGWAVVVPASEVLAPRLEYFITAQVQGQPAAERFASAEAPHPVLVIPSPDELERQDRLWRYRGHRSRARLAGEWIDQGHVTSTVGGGGWNDRSYRLEAEYLYRILATVDSLRFGIVTLRGDVPPPRAFADGNSVDPTRHTGIDYGYAEVAFSREEYVGLSGRLVLGADEVGFVPGFGLSLRLGHAAGSRLEVGVEVITRLGTDAWVGFSWDTVPRFPMSLTLHVANTPVAPLIPGSPATAPLDSRLDKGAPYGIRAVYECGYEVNSMLTVMGRLGYQARVSTAGGLALGAGVQVEW